MIDIVKRLRADQLGAPHLMGYDKENMTEAADEIERLRAALETIAKQRLVSEIDDDLRIADFEYDYEAIIAIARESLHKKDPAS
jgi:hypothetical protein